METEHSTVAGTTLYMAPEVMQAGSNFDGGDGGEGSQQPQEGESPKKSVKYGRKADIWSLGMTLCELANGESPYKSAAAAIYSVCVSKNLPRFPDIFSPEAHHFLTRSLTYDVRERADAGELLEHVFMAPRVCSIFFVSLCLSSLF
jgi:serine/threonine protein kinase